MGSKVCGRSCHFLLNKFFDPGTPSITKLDDGEKQGGKWWKKERKQAQLGGPHSKIKVELD